MARIHTAWMTVALLLVLLAGPALGGIPPNSCCVCSCEPGLCGQGPAGCEAVSETCGGLNQTVCLVRIQLNSTCADIAECAAAPRTGAPLAGPTALTGIAVLLGGLGLWRARRRSPA